MKTTLYLADSQLVKAYERDVNLRAGKYKGTVTPVTVETYEYDPENCCFVYDTYRRRLIVSEGQSHEQVMADGIEWLIANEPIFRTVEEAREKALALAAEREEARIARAQKRKALLTSDYVNVPTAARWLKVDPRRIFSEAKRVGIKIEQPTAKWRDSFIAKPDIERLREVLR